MPLLRVDVWVSDATCQVPPVLVISPVLCAVVMAPLLMFEVQQALTSSKATDECDVVGTAMNHPPHQSMLRWSRRRGMCPAMIRVLPVHR